VLVPLLWTAVAVGISLFIRLILDRFRVIILIPAVLGILALPLAAVTCSWAFFVHRLLWGWILFAAVMIPLGVSTVLGLYRIHKAD
jgi:hypothetical protein